MIEKIYNIKESQTKLVEKLIDDEHVVINHMVLPKDTNLPEHYANSHVYLVVLKGCMSITLEEQDVNYYVEGTIVNVPFNTKMFIQNKHHDLLEFLVIKAPNPRDMVEK
ncbi:MAG: cupin domain-containing protein [Bacillota bacterium]